MINVNFKKMLKDERTSKIYKATEVATFQFEKICELKETGSLMIAEAEESLRIKVNKAISYLLDDEKKTRTPYYKEHNVFTRFYDLKSDADKLKAVLQVNDLISTLLYQWNNN